MKIGFTQIALLLLLALPVCLKAQMVEQVDMSVSGNNYNTYLTGINNSQYVTGYYNDGSSNTGFIISKTGKRLLVDAVSLGFTDSKAEGINDQGVAVITFNNGSTVGIYKCYLDTLGDSIHHYSQVTGIVQPSSVAFDISNNNDIGGWFQSGLRYLWVKHDSIIPGGNSPYESDVYQTFNTMGGGINDANKVVGFYVDGININPVVYDNLTSTFNPLSTAFKVKLWDINNNNWVAGEFMQTTNNVYMAFIANVGTGSFTQFTSLATIFANTNIQSVANGINDQDDIVGSFFNPNSNTWMGFIYHPNITEFRIPGGFNVHDNSWGMLNSDAGTNHIWTTGYYQGSDYMNQDPYANNGVALVDDDIADAYHITSLPDNTSPTWKGFATEADKNQVGLSSNPDEQDYYRTILKAKMFDKYKALKSSTFKGYCYGFTMSSLLRYFDDAAFASWFGMPANTALQQVSNSNYTAVKAVERCQQKWHDKAIHARNRVSYGLWGGMYNLKTTFRKNILETDPAPLNIEMAPGQWHSVLPYKIRTQKILPFTAQDTVYVYDPNYPDDSSQYLTIEARYYNAANNWVNMASTAYSQLNKTFFERSGVRILQNVEHAQFKSTAAPIYEDAFTFLLASSYYDISMNGIAEVKLDGSGYLNDSLHVSPLHKHNTTEPTNVHAIDTTEKVDITTYNYTDNAMIWNQINGSRSMGITRSALISETDNSSQANGMISYGNPDATTKYLLAFMRENVDDLQTGVNIIARNICAEQGDSVVTSSPSTYVYNITKVNGSSTCTYELTVYAAYNGEVQVFTTETSIAPNSTHIIDPYYNGSNGTDITIQVDNGSDGNVDDTVQVTGVPVRLQHLIKDGGIRIYPNPVQDQLNIEFAKAGNYNVTISDIVGRSIYNSNIAATYRVQIPMMQFAAGAYLIQITDSKGTPVFKNKIIKQ